MYNEKSLDTLCAALSYAAGVDAPEKAAPADERLTAYVDEKLGGKKADRIFMYHARGCCSGSFSTTSTTTATLIWSLPTARTITKPPRVMSIR